jgi:hypothetical protein
MATANHIFAEPSPGVIAHTASSRLLAEDDDLRAWVGFNAEDIFPASAHVLQALQSDPAATSLVRAGFQFAFGTADQEPMFVTCGRDPERARRMGRAMASLTGGEGYEVRYLVDGYDFSDVDAAGGTLVDVGGSHGFVCVDLARKYRRMRFVVQDLQKTVDSAPRPVCEDAQVAERISFQAYDFFTPQVVEGADGKLQPPFLLSPTLQLLDPCLFRSGRKRRERENVMDDRLTQGPRGKQSTSSAGSCTTTRRPTPSRSSRTSCPRSSRAPASSSTTTACASRASRTPGTSASCGAWTWSCWRC